MPFGRFLVYNMAGSILGSAIYGLLGAAFGSQWQRIEHWAGHAGLLIAGILVLFGLVILLWRRANRHEVALRAGWRSFVNQPRIVAMRDWVAARLAAIQARMPRSEYLGLHLAVGAALIIGGSGCSARSQKGCCITSGSSRSALPSASSSPPTGNHGLRRRCMSCLFLGALP